MRLLPVFAAAVALLGLVGCETTEKPIDSTLPQAQPASLGRRHSARQPR
ncbi:MAG: hypothetical protein LW857_02720 [Verrucomicrobiae bacterium]|nr:hypothetical protein [Verrucomicrobiae bacterium]